MKSFLFWIFTFVELELLSVIASVVIFRLVDSYYIQNSTLSWARCWLIGVVNRDGSNLISLRVILVDAILQFLLVVCGRLIWLIQISSCILILLTVLATGCFYLWCFRWICSSLSFHLLTRFLCSSLSFHISLDLLLLYLRLHYLQLLYFLRRRALRRFRRMERFCRHLTIAAGGFNGYQEL